MTKGFWCGLLACMLLLFGGGAVLAQGGALPSITLMETVIGSLDEATPEARWQFEARAGDQVSVLVRTLSGDLDPVVQVLDETGRMVAQADDIAYPDRTDAALEGLELPRDGQYTVRVGRYEEARIATSGEFALSLLPAFAAPVYADSFDGVQDWRAGSGGLGEADLYEGQLLLEIDTANALGWAAPDDPPQVPLNAYIQVDAAVANEPDYWEFGIIFRQLNPTNYYLFSVSGRGDWAFLARSGGSTWIHLQDWTTHPALETVGGAARLGVLMEEGTFTFFVNGTALGTVTADVIQSPGEIALSAGTIDLQQTFPFVVFDNLLITEPLPQDENADVLDTVQSWQAPESTLILEELAGAGLVQEGGSQVMLVRDSFTTVSRAGINILPLGQGRTQTDFVMSTIITMESEGADNACGVIFRQEEAERYGLAFTDGTGGLGVAYRQDAQFDPAFYVDGVFDSVAGLRLLLVGQGEAVWVYLDGELQAVHTHPAEPGVVGIAALSYDGQFTDCRFGETWLWTWD